MTRDRSHCELFAVFSAVVFASAAVVGLIGGVGSWICRKIGQDRTAALSA